MARKVRTQVTEAAKRELERAREDYTSDAAMNMRANWNKREHFQQAKETAERFNWLQKQRRDGKL